MSMSVSQPQSSAKSYAEFGFDADVLNAAEVLRISSLGTCDQRLRGVVSPGQTRRWQHEYANFVTAYNATLKTEGLPLAEFSAF